MYFTDIITPDMLYFCAVSLLVNMDHRGWINYEPADIDRLASPSTNTTSLEESCIKAILLKAEFEENVMKGMDHPKAFGFFKHRDVCLNARCMKAALEIQRNLDPDTDPCEDFYQFACGGWIERHAIPEKYFGSSPTSELEADHDHKLRVLLEKELTAEEPDFIHKVKEMYDSCMDLERIENVSSQPLAKVLSALGGWPVVKGKHWNENTFDWVEILILLRKMGYSHNIPIELSVVQGDSDLPFIILLDQPSLGMPDRAFLMGDLESHSRTAYFKLMLKAANKMGADGYTSEEELREVLNFEAKLANLSLTRMEREKMEVDTKRKIEVQNLMNMTEKVNWLTYFNGLLNDEVNESTPLLINNQDLINMSIHLFTETNQRVVANYIIWKVVEESLPLLSEEWRTLGQEFSTLVKEEEAPRYEHCLSIFTRDTLGVALSSYYVRHYFIDDNYKDALEVAGYIHEEVLNILENTHSVDEETKNKIIEKVNAIKYHIGYPKELLNDSVISDLYANLTLNSQDYFENALKVRKWYTDLSFSHLKKPWTNDEWKINSNATQANAFYRKWRNSIDILGGLLKFPFYENRRPRYLNFGAIGFILGHELMHGLNFIVQNVGKSKNGTDEVCRKKVQCIKEQYDNYTAENGMKLNAIKMLSENIADNGGFKIAYLAYQRWLGDHKIESNLPGLDYTNNQLFWINAAQGWCQNLTPEDIWSYIKDAKYPPFKFRVIGAMSNLPEFSRDFNCTRGSPMNPKNKCGIW